VLRGRFGGLFFIRLAVTAFIGEPLLFEFLLEGILRFACAGFRFLQAEVRAEIVVFAGRFVPRRSAPFGSASFFRPASTFGRLSVRGRLRSAGTGMSWRGVG
jgi:hypothetical protein